MKIYISGPMSGLPDLNFPAFAEAAKKLAQDGHEPINPATLNRDGASWHECMRNDIRALVDCDALVLLKGWEKSNGAQIEMNLAHRLGLQILFFENFESALSCVGGV